MTKPNFTPFPEIITERLLLREIQFSDKKELFFLRSDETVNNFIDRARPESLADIDTFIEMLHEETKKNKWIDWGINLKNDPKLIGSICLWNFSDDFTRAEIGYELNPKYQGKGIMGEAMESIITFGFETLNLSYIDAYTHKENISSTKLLVKFGFEQDYNRVDEECKDNVIFTKVKKD